MDVDLPLDGDLTLTQNGDIELATPRDEVVQRIERRCLTNARAFINGTAVPPDYLGDPSFGMGLGRMIEGKFSRQQIISIQSIIKEGILQDSQVDATYKPIITFSQPNPSELDFTANFNLISGQYITITFSLAPEIN